MIRILYAAMKKRVNRTNLFVLIFFGTGANFTLIFPFIFFGRHSLGRCGRSNGTAIATFVMI